MEIGDLSNCTELDGYARRTARDNRSMEWEPVESDVLTGVSMLWAEGKHAECPGHAPSEANNGDTVFCVCDCHAIAEADLPPQLRSR